MELVNYKNHILKILFIAVAYLVSLPSVNASSNFDFSLGIDYSSADEVLDFFEYKTNDSKRVSELRGNRLVAATSELLARVEKSKDDFCRQLELARAYEGFESDVYGFSLARKNIAQLRKLLDELKKRKIDKKIVATLAAFFPEQAKFSTRFSVYFVVIGNEKATAFVRHVIWKYDTPVFVDEERGEPVIVVNLARVAEVTTDLDAQFIEVLSVTAHECFHSVYSVVQKSLPLSVKPKNYAESLLEIVQNEGIAYYLSMQIHIGTERPSFLWFEQTANAIRVLNGALLELYSTNITEHRAMELLMSANLSGSFEGNYGSTAGLRMAYEIDRLLGRVELTQTILGGGRAFLLAYKNACLKDPTLPKVDSKILKLIE